MSGTSLSPTQVSESVFEYAVGLAQAGRVFTMRQLARHREISWRTQPLKRASEFLSPYRDRFEVIPWQRDKPFLWRLTEREKRRRGLRYPNVGASQHTEHWLVLGDLWAHLVAHGLRPEKWFTEGKDIGRFDVFAVVRGQPYLFEVQLTPLKDREWIDKWRRRVEWLRLQLWKEREWAEQFAGMPPKVVLVTREPMKNLREGVTVPRGVTVVARLENVARVMSGQIAPK